MEQVLLYLPFMLSVVVAVYCICFRLRVDREADDVIKKELSTNERRIAEAADRASDCRKTTEECEAIAERTADNQRKIEEKTESARELAKSSRSRAERISSFIEDCERILSEAKKKE